jgi:four helix bundle protein
MSFVALDLSLELVRTLAPLCTRLAQHDPKLVDQLRRAATSVALNLAEGAGRAGRDRKHLARVAYASAAEVAAALQVAVAWGYLGSADVVGALAQVDRVRAVTFGLAR